MRFSPRTVGLAAAVVTVLVWTSFIVISRATAGRSMAPLDIALARILGAAAVLLPWGWWWVRRQARAGAGAASSFFGLSPLGWRVTATLGLFGGLGYALLVYTGFVFAPATHAAVLMPGSLPLWTALLAALVLGDRITPARALCLACILGGDLLVGGASLFRALDGGEVWKGDVLFMCSSLCWACYSVWARKLRLAAVPATIAVTVFAFFSFLPLYALLTFSGAVVSRLADATWREFVFQMLFHGLGSVVISGITFMHMVRYFGPVRSTLITALVPGLSALGAVLFLNEPLHAHLLAGLGLVTAGIVFGVRGSGGALAPAQPPATLNAAPASTTPGPTP